jgi:hypothetical protein
LPVRGLQENIAAPVMDRRDSQEFVFAVGFEISEMAT